MWTRILGGLLVFAAFFYLTAGTLAYWEGWIYFLKHDPEVIERRMRLKEKELTQKRVIKVSWIVALAIFAIPGLEHRYGLSSVPMSVALAADVGVLLGYWGFAKVLLANRYASRIIEVAKGQKVIETGPYALVRHPMYINEEKVLQKDLPGYKAYMKKIKYRLVPGMW